jgi:hypothetical protein
VFIALFATLAFGIWLLVQETFFIVHPQDKEILWEAEGRDPFVVEYPSAGEIRSKIIGNTGYGVNTSWGVFNSRFYFFTDGKWFSLGQSESGKAGIGNFRYGDGIWFLSPRIETMKDGWRIKIRIVNFFCMVADLFPNCRAIRDIRHPTFWAYLEDFHSGDVANITTGARRGIKPRPPLDVTRPKSFREVIDHLNGTDEASK